MNTQTNTTSITNSCGRYIGLPENDVLIWNQPIFFLKDDLESNLSYTSVVFFICPQNTSNLFMHLTCFDNMGHIYIICHGYGYSPFLHLHVKVLLYAVLNHFDDNYPLAIVTSVIDKGEITYLGKTTFVINLNNVCFALDVFWVSFRG